MDWTGRVCESGGAPWEEASVEAEACDACPSGVVEERRNVRVPFMALPSRLDLRAEFC